MADNGNGNGNGVWKYIAISAVSVVLTLLGAWATHSVSTEQLSEALSASNAVHNVEIQNIKSQLAVDDMTINHLSNMITELQFRLDRMGKR